MSKVKLRIIPIIKSDGLRYQVQKKGWLRWSIDKSSAGSQCIHGYCTLYIAKEYERIREATVAIKSHYGKNYVILDYQP